MTEAQILKRIYPSIVTFGGDWRKMLKEVSDLKLTEISLFLTCANKTERQEIYKALKKTKVKKIPHIHARHDMTQDEFDYLVKTYNTKAFTVHYQYYLKYLKGFKHQDKFFIENNGYGADIKNLSVLKQVGGVCIDLSHLEHHRRHIYQHKKKYETAVKAASTYKVGCNHLSAVLPNGLSHHKVKNFSELEYVKNIPKHFFSPYINLELGNSIKQQLIFKKKLAKLLVKSWNK